MTDEALNAAKNADAVILGAIGGPVCTLFHWLVMHAISSVAALTRTP